MAQKCILCGEKIEEEFGKLNGTIVKAKNEYNKNQLIYVCSTCQKKDGWVENAKVKGV